MPSYFRQADEIFSKSVESTQQTTHPEPFMRARALQLWETQGESAELEIARMIEGPATLDALDLLGRQKVAQTTRRLSADFCRPPGCEPICSSRNARQFFDDFAVGDGQSNSLVDGQFDADLEAADPALRDYFCYVLLDFAVADQGLDDLPLSTALVTARQVGLGPRFSEIAAKELGFPKKRFAKIEAAAERRVAAATTDEASPTIEKNYDV